jgi:hypothetical protein
MVAALIERDLYLDGKTRLLWDKFTDHFPDIKPSSIKSPAPCRMAEDIGKVQSWRKPQFGDHRRFLHYPFLCVLGLLL